MGRKNVTKAKSQAKILNEIAANEEPKMIGIKKNLVKILKKLQNIKTYHQNSVILQFGESGTGKSLTISLVKEYLSQVTKTNINIYQYMYDSFVSQEFKLSVVATLLNLCTDQNHCTENRAEKLLCNHFETSECYEIVIIDQFETFFFDITSVSAKRGLKALKRLYQLSRLKKNSKVLFYFSTNRRDLVEHINLTFKSNLLSFTFGVYSEDEKQKLLESFLKNKNKSRDIFKERAFRELLALCDGEGGVYRVRHIIENILAARTGDKPISTAVVKTEELKLSGYTVLSEKEVSLRLLLAVYLYERDEATKKEKKQRKKSKRKRKRKFNLTVSELYGFYTDNMFKLGKTSLISAIASKEECRMVVEHLRFKGYFSINDERGYTGWDARIYLNDGLDISRTKNILLRDSLVSDILKQEEIVYF